MQCALLLSSEVHQPHGRFIEHLHCAAKNCSALHAQNTALHCTTLHSTALKFTTLAIIDVDALSCTAPPMAISLRFIGNLHCAANKLQCILCSKYCTSLHFTALHCTALHFDSLYWPLLSLIYFTAMHLQKQYHYRFSGTALHCNALRWLLLSLMYFTTLHLQW